MHFYISLDGILERLNKSMLKVKHITAFIKEETLQSGIEYAILTFAVASLFIVGFILLRRTIALEKGKKKKKLIAKYENYLAETITYTYENNKIFEKKRYQFYLDKEDQTNPFNRQILLAQIILMRKHVGGNESLVLSNLYEKLGFRKASLKKTTSLLWHTRLEGLQELLLMSANSIENAVLRMMNDSHPFIRIEAMRALILRGLDWQKPLIRYNFQLSAWEQYQMCDALSRVQEISLPDYTPLLKSYNPTVVMFALRMIKHFHCMDAINEVAPFLQSPNEKIVLLAKEVVEQFGFTESDFADLENIDLVPLDTNPIQQSDSDIDAMVAKMLEDAKRLHEQYATPAEKHEAEILESIELEEELKDIQPILEEQENKGVSTPNIQIQFSENGELLDMKLDFDNKKTAEHAKDTKEISLLVPIFEKIETPQSLKAKGKTSKEAQNTEGVQFIDNQEDMINTVTENELMREIMIATMELRWQIAEDKKRTSLRQIKTVCNDIWQLIDDSLRHSKS